MHTSVYAILEVHNLTVTISYEFKSNIGLYIAIHGMYSYRYIPIAHIGFLVGVGEHLFCILNLCAIAI